jgi:serine/threonine-protein kinase ATR
VFHEWFVEVFSEPSAWFSSRIAYSRTSAVMSMVGHVLGLGDRHGENILFDETNGDTLHVDFNCLFDKVIPHPLSIQNTGRTRLTGWLKLNLGPLV